MVEIKAASLNYRDLLQARVDAGLIPLSDGAGIVAAVGPGVRDVRSGLRVAIGFMPGWVEGAFSALKQASALGGAGGGRRAGGAHQRAGRRRRADPPRDEL